VALAEGGLRGEVREYGRITNTPAVLRRLAHKLGQAGVALRFCYEAGPCGYGIQRQLSALARECIVAPSLIPNLGEPSYRRRFSLWGPAYDADRDPTPLMLRARGRGAANTRGH